MERAAFEYKIDAVINKLGVSNKCPVICLFATARDIYRKPCKGMWNILKEDILGENKCEILREDSFYVGDAAGRMAGWKSGKSADWSSVDRKFAINAGIKFYTPEEFFLDEPLNKLIDLGRDPRNLPVRIREPLLLDDHMATIKNEESVVLMAVGYPASGKTTFYERHFKDKKFVHVNQDTLKTNKKCIVQVSQALKNNQSVYIDNTNPTRESRQVFIQLAKELNVQVKCLHFTADEWLCKHLNVFRSITKSTEQLPAVAFNSFRSKYQPPCEAEGFHEIVVIPFDCVFRNNEESEIFSNYLL